MLGAWARPRRSTPPESATCCHALATSGSRACNCLAQGAPNVSAPFPNERGSSWHFPAPMVLGSRPHECMRGPSRVALWLWGGGGHPAGRWNRLSPRWGGAQLRATRSTQRGCSGGASEGRVEEAGVAPVCELRAPAGAPHRPQPACRAPLTGRRSPCSETSGRCRTQGRPLSSPPPTPCRAPHVAVSLCSPRLRHPLHAGASEGSAPRTSSLCTLPVPPMIKL